MVSNKGKTVTFRESIENQVNEEVDRILKEMDRLKLDANQAVLVLNSLNLPVPEKLRELVKIEIVPKSRTITLPPLKSIPDDAVEDHSEKMATQLMQDNPLLGKKQNHTRRIQRMQAKAEQRTKQAAQDLRIVLGKGPLKPYTVYSEMKKLGYGSTITENGFKRLKELGEAKTQFVKTFQGGNEWVLTSHPCTLEALRDEATKKEGVLPLDELTDKLGFTKTWHLYKMLDDLVKRGTLTYDGGVYRYEKPKGTFVKDAVAKKNGNRRNRTVAGTGRGAKLSSDKEVRQILAKAEAVGAQTKKQGNDHIAVTYKGTTKILASSPGDSNRSNREKLKDLGISV